MNAPPLQRYLKFLEQTEQNEFEIGNLAFELSKLFTDFPPKMRLTQAFNIVLRFAHRTPGWEISANQKYQKTIRRK